MMSNDDIRRRVSRQYERYPYPAAEESLDTFIANRSFQAGCPSRFFHLYWPYRAMTDDLDILVAGCGTMQAPKFAINLPGARITAIDISENSIGHTRRLLDRHGIGNVETRLLPIEQIGELGREFDLVISTGVLHHLPKPADGLAALRAVLRREGSMYLMLYGKYGRDGIYYLQELFRRAGLTAEDSSIADLQAIRGLLAQLPPEHPIRAKQFYFNDYQVGDEELVDLFLHAQDRGYTIPAIVEWLEACDMHLQSMLYRAHYAPQCSALRDSVLAMQISQLPDNEQLAIGELFRASSLMHFFIACRSDRSLASFEVSLEADDWEALIPVKSPVILQEAISAVDGKVARVHSPMHQYSDIDTYLDNIEFALFGMVDGKTSISDIRSRLVDSLPAVADDTRVRDFLTRMYDHDYLAFRGQVD